MSMAKNAFYPTKKGRRTLYGVFVPENRFSIKCAFSFSPQVIEHLAIPYPWKYNHCHRGGHSDEVGCDGDDRKASRGCVARH